MITITLFPSNPLLYVPKTYFNTKICALLNGSCDLSFCEAVCIRQIKIKSQQKDEFLFF